MHDMRTLQCPFIFMFVSIFVMFLTMISLTGSFIVAILRALFGSVIVSYFIQNFIADCCR